MIPSSEQYRNAVAANAQAYRSWLSSADPTWANRRLFNRLVGARKAIVDDLPGVTRDRNYAEARVGRDESISVVDTGGLD